MPKCDSCNITEKLYQCCGRHPLTGEKVQLTLANGMIVVACPHLDSMARCSIYDIRPLGCRQFTCKHQNADLHCPPFVYTLYKQQ